jgi:hypothetical protein
MGNKIRAKLIFEMLGKPPEFLKESLEEHVKSLETDKIKVISKNIHEPNLLKNDRDESKSLYSSFAEVELEIEDITILFGIIFRTLPSHIEILSPSELIIRNFDLSNIVSELAIKLHKYDEVTKVLMMERDNFARQLNAIRGNIIKNMKVDEIKENITDKVEFKPDSNIKKKDKKKK